jgi:circadian clock protein KaiC
MPRKRIPTYVRGFDEELGGGVPEGQIVLVRGATGTMKSSLSYFMLYQNALHGRRGLYITLEQEAASLLEQMAALGLKPTAVATELPVLDLSRGREHLDALAGKAKTHGASLTRVLQGRIEQLKRELRFELLAIDPWDALSLVLEFQEPRTETFAFFEWLRDLGVTSFLVSEIPPGPSRGDAFEEEFLADAIFYLKMEPTGDVDFRRRLQAAKMRSANITTDFFTLLFERGRFEVARSIS